MKTKWRSDEFMKPTWCFTAVEACMFSKTGFYEDFES